MGHLSETIDVTVSSGNSGATHDKKVDPFQGLQLDRWRAYDFEDYNTPIPPALTAPFELVQNVFAFYDRSPDILGQICSSWRQVALQSPKLWIYLDIDFHSRNHRGLIELSKMQLVRSGTLKVVLEIDMSDLEDVTIDPIVELIAPNIARIHKLTLKVPTKFLQSFYTLPPGLLVSLEIYTAVCRGAVSRLPRINATHCLRTCD